MRFFWEIFFENVNCTPGGKEGGRGNEKCEMRNEEENNKTTPKIEKKNQQTLVNIPINRQE